MKASFNHTKHIVRYVPNHYPANRTISYCCMSSLLLMFLARRRLVCLSPILSTTRSFSLKWYCGKISDVCVPRLSLPATSNATTKSCDRSSLLSRRTPQAVMAYPIKRAPASILRSLFSIQRITPSSQLLSASVLSEIKTKMLNT